MRKKVIILGAGVGGLTVAHELLHSNPSKYEIHIHEKNSIIGGMARSHYKMRNGVQLPTEYCWRIYGPNYYNLREILKKIPLKDDVTKNVHDNLVDISDYFVADTNTIFKMGNQLTTLLTFVRALKNVPFKQKIKVFSKVIYCFMISTQRLNSLDDIRWKDYIDPDNTLNHDMKKYIIDVMGPYLGAEANQVNVPSVAKTLETFKMFNRPFSVMSGPTNVAWFDHWKSYLESHGIIFHLNSEIADICIHQNTVRSVVTKDGTEVIGDIFFCGLPVERVATIPSLPFKNIDKLAQLGYQRMVGIQLYFDKKIILPLKNTVMYIPDSPWQLVIEPQGSIWNKQYGDIADHWSIGLCDPIRSGLSIQKPFVKCTDDEIKTEVWHQIMTSEFSKYLQLETIQILDYHLWDSYIYNGKELVTSEPKFSTNKGTLRLRPQNKSELSNLYFATGYTRTETDMFEMESAAESGRRAAKLLEHSVRVIGSDRPIFLMPYRWLDSLFPKFDLYKKFPLICYCLGLPIAVLAFPFLYLATSIALMLSRE